MKQIPMLFNPVMVVAIQEDRKTQTRRTSFSGKVGDLIWVKEMHYKYGEWQKNGKTKTGKPAWKFYAFPDWKTRYADNIQHNRIAPNSYRQHGWYKRNSLFMEKEDARIWLKITEVRNERLMHITNEDAIAEGLSKISKDQGRTWKYGIPDSDGLPGNDNTGWHWHEWEVSAKRSFLKLWANINGIESLKSNPSVKAITFIKTSKPE